MPTLATVSGRKMSDCRMTALASLWSSASNMARFQTFSRYWTARFTNASDDEQDGQHPGRDARAAPPEAERRFPEGREEVLPGLAVVLLCHPPAPPPRRQRRPGRACQCTTSRRAPANRIVRAADFLVRWLRRRASRPAAYQRGSRRLARVRARARRLPGSAHRGPRCSCRRADRPRQPPRPARAR